MSNWIVSEYGSLVNLKTCGIVYLDENTKMVKIEIGGEYVGLTKAIDPEAAARYLARLAKHLHAMPFEEAEVAAFPAQVPIQMRTPGTQFYVDTEDNEEFLCVKGGLIYTKPRTGNDIYTYNVATGVLDDDSQSHRIHPDWLTQFQAAAKAQEAK